MELGLKGKVALVTGSSRGIGRGIALALAEQGCDLMLTARDAKALEDAAQAIRAKQRKSAVCALDLREPSAAETLVEAVRHEFGGLDILVNNAGATKRGDFFALTDADWEDGYALKFFAHVRLARAAWPLLKARRGALVAIGGASGRQAGKAFPIRSSVKAPGPPLPTMPGGSRQGRRRPSQLHPSLARRDRAAMAAHPRRGRADGGAGGKSTRPVLPRGRYHTIRHRRGRGRLHHLHRLLARDVAARRDRGSRRRRDPGAVMHSRGCMPCPQP